MNAMPTVMFDEVRDSARPAQAREDDGGCSSSGSPVVARCDEKARTHAVNARIKQQEATHLREIQPGPPRD